jgi:hypothetical protein
MKKYLLLLLLASFSVEAQIVNIPDANFKAKLLQSSPSNQIAQNQNYENIKIDVNNDGEIQESEALLVRRLNISNANIASLEGINNFINLEDLLVNNNNLTNLDLSSLTYIRLVDLSSNQINAQSNLNFSIDYSTVFELRLNNNLLTTFNLNQFILENSFSFLNIYIDLSFNPIDTIDLENTTNSDIFIDVVLNNTLLEELIIDSDLLNNLTVKNNTLLSNVDVKGSSLLSIFIEDNSLLQDLKITSVITNIIYDLSIKNPLGVIK